MTLSLMQELISDLPISGFSTSNTELLFHLLPTEEQQCVNSSAILKRKIDFSNGRVCAKEALARLGIQKFPVLKGIEGNPVWPAECVGSISHTINLSAAVVAFKSNVSILGVDVERLDHKINEAMAKIICHSRELDTLQDLVSPQHDQQTILTLYFSARESIFKAIYAHDGQKLTYQDVQIRLDLNKSQFSVSFEKFPQLRHELSGRFVIGTNHLMTLVYCGNPSA